jgi:hypothetical protein
VLAKSNKNDAFEPTTTLIAWGEVWIMGWSLVQRPFGCYLSSLPLWGEDAKAQVSHSWSSDCPLVIRLPWKYKL